MFQAHFTRLWFDFYVSVLLARVSWQSTFSAAYRSDGFHVCVCEAEADSKLINIDFTSRLMNHNSLSLSFFPSQSVYLFHFSVSFCLSLPPLFPSLTLILFHRSITLSHLIPLAHSSLYPGPVGLLPPLPPPPCLPFTVISSFFILQLSSPLSFKPLSSFLTAYCPRSILIHLLHLRCPPLLSSFLQACIDIFSFYYRSFLLPP